MLDENTGFFYYKNRAISLTFHEVCLLTVLIKCKHMRVPIDFITKYTKLDENKTRVYLCRLNKKLNGILKIRSKAKEGFKIEYLGE